MNLLPLPKLSRPLGACWLLYSSLARLVASYACSTAAEPGSLTRAQTMPFPVPFELTPGVAPGYPKLVFEVLVGAVESFALLTEKARKTSLTPP